MLTTTNSLNETFAVSPATIESFQKNGHVLIKGVLPSEEVPEHRQAILQAVKNHNTEKRKLEERDTYGKAFLQIMNLWEVNEQVRKFVLAKRFGKIAAGLMGVKNVRLYHDQALFKEPGGGPTPWHQDQYYWPVDTNNTITMWMPLIDIDVKMGMLTFASGSHKEGLVKNLSISDASEAALDNHVAERKFPVVRPDFMKAGDATWHAGLTLHKAPGNQSDQTREVFTIIYIADGCRITPPKNDEQEADRLRWFNGLPAGELAASELNPLI